MDGDGLFLQLMSMGFSADPLTDPHTLALQTRSYVVGRITTAILLVSLVTIASLKGKDR
jgi:hypothetical protein